jgi:hypothetical protein
MNFIETILIENDFPVFFVTADSYPDGIFPAFKKLHALIPFSPTRKYISLSRPENGGKIIYRAGAAELEAGDLAHLNLEAIVVKKGKYISLTLQNYRNDLSTIGKTFQILTAQEHIDPLGYCVEWYKSEIEMLCLVKLKDEEA